MSFGSPEQKLPSERFAGFRQNRRDAFFDYGSRKDFQIIEEPAGHLERASGQLLLEEDEQLLLQNLLCRLQTVPQD